MNTKMMKMGAFLGAVALTVSGCFNLDENKSTYEGNILVHYEPDYDYEMEEFLHTFFNDGKDSVSINKYLSIGPVTHSSNVDEDKELVGGFALCTGIDTLAGPDRRLARFAVFDDGGCDKTLAYAVFHDTLSTLMPEKLIQVFLSSEESSCDLKKIFVQNVQAVVQAAKYGTGLSGGPFTDDDFLTLTLIGYKGNVSKGSKTVKLVDGTKILDKWTEVDLSSMSGVDHLELHLEASRPDCPLYCCIDNLYFHYRDVY
jgi:hypothetical protein